MDKESKLAVYIIPKNIKKGKMYFGRYKLTDIIIVGSSLLTMFVGSILSLAILKGKLMFVFILIFLLVGGVGMLLTTPFPNYHNVKGYLVELIEHFKSERKYIYGGKYYEE